MARMSWSLRELVDFLAHNGPRLGPGVPPASEFVNHDRGLIPNHLEGKLITLQEVLDHAQPTTCATGPQASQAAGSPPAGSWPGVRRVRPGCWWAARAGRGRSG